MQGTHLKRFLRTFEVLTDLGPELTADRDFRQTAYTMLAAAMETVGAREGALFSFSERPSLLTSVAAQGFALLPEPSLIPLIPRHVHSLTAASGPLLLDGSSYDVFLSSNGNVAPELFKCLCPLKVCGKLAGTIALGRRPGDAIYEEDALFALQMLSPYLALAIQNHNLSQTLTQRISENMRLLASLHTFHDNALEAFAYAIDIKHTGFYGHSLRVGRYAQAIGEALGMDPNEVASLRSAAYLHDIGMVAIDKRLCGKASPLDAEEAREMRDHTIIGHQIVSQVRFPWAHVREIVRWHHERADGSGYPDGLHGDDIPLAVRIVALADTFDAMISERPYRGRMSVPAAFEELIRLTPEKYDPHALQALLIQVRRDVIGTSHIPVLEREPIDLSAVDVDQLASSLQDRISQDRPFSSSF